MFAFSGGFWEYRDKTKEGYSPSRIYWGSKDGFNSDHFTQLWTVGATDVAVGNLNGDVWPDLVFANGSGEESFIYFGSDQGYDEENRLTLPTNAPHAVELKDIDNNGSLDIIFANEKDDHSFAYLNVSGKFSPENRIEFETYSAKDVVVNDYNKDGFADLFFTNHQYSLSGDPNLANRLIDSYLYFGSAAGFNSKNRLSIPTIGAWGANAADLNKDGWTDLLVCNFQEHYSYEVPSFIYWNGPKGFSSTRRTPLYEHGAQGNAIADLDGDGNLDIIITSMMGNSRGDYDPNYLYWGNEKGLYSSKNRLELPGREAYEQAMADLDDDGQTDILIINRGETTRKINELFIYWNNQNDFTSWNMSGLPVNEGVGVEVADLDRDGFLDIIISNFKSLTKDTTIEPDDGSFIYWGGPTGWAITDRTNLTITRTRSPAICDINFDGYLDLIFGQQGVESMATIFFGNGTREFTRQRSAVLQGSEGTGSPGVADFDKDGRLDIAFAHDKNVLIYYQDKNGSFSVNRLASFPVQAKTMGVADVNNDGWLDLLCPFYKGKGIRSWFSTVLLGSKKGFSLERVIKLPTDGATGSLISDFNRDGYPDIFFFCHRADGSFDEIGKFGDHHVNSLLYWGSANGFKPENKLEIPTVGVHYDMGIDLGHIRDRGFLHEYISSAFYADNKLPSEIAWNANVPHRTSIKFQLRSAESREKLKNASWKGPSGVNSYYTASGTKIRDLKKTKWLQYRVIFDTDNGANSPILEAVEISFK